MVFLLSINLERDSDISADEAVMEYRDYFAQHKKHDPKKLKKVLYGQYRHEDPEVRRNIAEVAGELPEPDFDFLWDIIKNETVSIVRCAALEALRHSNKDLVMKYVITQLESQDVKVRRKAAETSGKLGDETTLKILIKVFQNETNIINKIEMASAMVRLGEDVKIKFIIEALKTNANVKIRKYAARTVLFLESELDKNILGDQMKQSYENDPFVKLWLTAIFANRGDELSIATLKNIVSDDRLAISLRSEGAHALCEIGEYKYAYLFLIDFVKNGQDYFIREQAIEDLVRFKEYPLVSIFSEILLTDDHAIVREIAAWAMGERKEKGSLLYLEKALYDDSAFVRTGAIAAIYKIISTRRKLSKKPKIIK